MEYCVDILVDLSTAITKILGKQNLVKLLANPVVQRILKHGVNVESVSLRMKKCAHQLMTDLES